MSSYTPMHKGRLDNRSPTGRALWTPRGVRLLLAKVAKDPGMEPARKEAAIRAILEGAKERAIEIGLPELL